MVSDAAGSGCPARARYPLYRSGDTESVHLNWRWGNAGASLPLGIREAHVSSVSRIPRGNLERIAFAESRTPSLPLLWLGL